MAKQPIHVGWAARVGAGAGSETQPWLRPDLYGELIGMIERAGVDFILVSEAQRPTLSPVILAGAWSAKTRTIGIVPEMLTTDYPPFKLARLIGTLNHVTEGRIGWAMDTSLTQSGAHNYGFEGPPPAELRHVIAAEYVEVCNKLFDSWAPDALVESPEAGIFADPPKVRPIHHAGKYFKVRGPLNIMTAPHGTPLLVQTVRTDEEIRFAGQYADLAIVAGRTVDDVSRARKQLEAAATAAGRTADAVKVYFTVSIRAGETPEAIAAWQRPSGGGIDLSGSVEAVASQLEDTFDAAQCDGVVVQGSWVATEINVICNNVLATLRRRGRIALPNPALSLRRRLLGANLAQIESAAPQRQGSLRA